MRRSSPWLSVLNLDYSVLHKHKVMGRTPMLTYTRNEFMKIHVTLCETSSYMLPSWLWMGKWKQLASLNPDAKWVRELVGNSTPECWCKTSSQWKMGMPLQKQSSLLPKWLATQLCHISLTRGLWGRRWGLRGDCVMWAAEVCLLPALEGHSRPKHSLGS